MKLNEKDLDNLAAWAEHQAYRARRKQYPYWENDVKQLHMVLALVEVEIARQEDLRYKCGTAETAEGFSSSIPDEEIPF